MCIIRNDLIHNNITITRITRVNKKINAHSNLYNQITLTTSQQTTHYAECTEETLLHGFSVI